MKQGGGIPAEAILDLRRRLAQLSPRHPERREIIEGAVILFGVSRATIYRALSDHLKPKGVPRSDKGDPRKIARVELEHYCEIIAALKIRTSNRKGRRISTIRAIELLEQYGVETPSGLVRSPEGQLNKATVNRYLKLWGYDHTRMIRPPAAVRFEATTSNAMWQFDISPSDLKEIEQPAWIDPNRKKAPTPMLFSVVDDRSGVSYQEYRCVYGEDAESGLRFLFNAMAPKEGTGPALQGIPEVLYLDNGPIAKSGVFQTVMERLDVKVMTHLPAGQDGRRTTARSKGKVERPFRTVKEAHETLYHFHKPETEQEANNWLLRFIERYNARPHRREPHTDALPFNGLGEEGRAYLDWLIKSCTPEETDIDTIIESSALELLTIKLNTPLQFTEYLNRAFEEGYRLGQKPVTSEIIESIMTPDFNNLEPKLTRQGYSVKTLADQFYVRPVEIRQFLNGQLDTNRTRELSDQMRAAGIAI